MNGPIESLLQEVGDFQSRARAYTRRGRLNEAAEYLEQAVRMIESRVSMVRLEESDTSATARLSAVLADTYGRLGGVRRRQGDLDAALHAYRNGAALERNTAVQLVNSYNSTNALVVEFLIHPALDKSRIEALEYARQTTLEQAEGPRREEWWVWADVAVLSVLLGDAEAARRAFDRFHRIGARPTDIDSVLPVLTEIAHSAAAIDGDIEAVAREMTSLLTELRDAR